MKSLDLERHQNSLRATAEIRSKARQAKRQVSVLSLNFVIAVKLLDGRRISRPEKGILAIAKISVKQHVEKENVGVLIQSKCLVFKLLDLHRGLTLSSPWSPGTVDES
ncbi:hypothetical protein J6590_082601 [Homalodisca vitripennis]|nr:hypothetical protein J6590_082601 [Homalodisca vitripennis]